MRVVVQARALEWPAVASSDECSRRLRFVQVKLLDVFEDPEHLMLITEMCAGDLFTRLRSAPDGRFCDTDASRLSSQIVSGVAYLHAHGVVHCDLKPSNVSLKCRAQTPCRARSCELPPLICRIAAGSPLARPPPTALFPPSLPTLTRSADSPLLFRPAGCRALHLPHTDPRCGVRGN